jgi:NTP pyrophosphatase (non-canonical NTP hydrolase)
MATVTNLTFTQLREANEKRCKAWHATKGQEWDVADRITEATGEMGELADALTNFVLMTKFTGHVGAVANIAKKLRRIECGMIGNDPSQAEELRKQLEMEMGDAAICLDLLAIELDINLGGVIIEKFNKTSIKVGLWPEHRLGRICEHQGCSNPCAEKLGYCPLCYDA